MICLEERARRPRRQRFRDCSERTSEANRTASRTTLEAILTDRVERIITGYFPESDGMILILAVLGRN